MDPETAITIFVPTHTISSDPRVKQVRKKWIFRIICKCFIFIGNPPSNYINASWVKFPKDQMKYIATQAPLRKHDDISGIETFWEMILNKKVKNTYACSSCFKSSLVPMV